MILDIDIKVSNDNGIQVHQFTKHFDSRFEGKSGIDSNFNSVSKDFEEFLAEFLSSSGRVIRNNLITEQTAASSALKNYDNDYTNIEYTIKLGETESITGKIPLDKLFRLSELSRLANQSVTENSNKTEDVTSSNTASYIALQEGTTDTAFIADSNEELISKRNPFKTPIDLLEVDEIFRQFITNAVTRYEDSFYVKESENSSFAKSS